MAAHLEHLYVVLKEFNHTTTSNKETLIRYFYKKLRPFIQVKLNNQGHDLDLWEKVVEKSVNINVKTSL